MKKVIVIAGLILVTAMLGFSQPRGANQEPFFGYTVGYGPVKLPSVNPLSPGVPTQGGERRSFTHGVTLGYTFYLHKAKDIKPNKLGISMDVNVQFHDGRPVMSTVAGGLVYKIRADRRVQPFVRVMAGGARLGFKSVFINGVGLRSTAQYSPAVIAGAGFDIAKDKDKSRVKWRIGADYVQTWFRDGSQRVVRGTTGIVF